MSWKPNIVTNLRKKNCPLSTLSFHWFHQIHSQKSTNLVRVNHTILISFNEIHWIFCVNHKNRSNQGSIFMFITTTISFVNLQNTINLWTCTICRQLTFFLLWVKKYHQFITTTVGKALKDILAKFFDVYWNLEIINSL